MSTVEVRPATRGDGAAVARLAAALARSFPFSPDAFAATYPVVLASVDARVLVADDGADLVGYLLGSWHRTFYAGGPVAVVEEILVREDVRGRGIGRGLMAALEDWAVGHGCVLATLATRRAGPFYQALGYEESAEYFRKVLPGR